MNAKSLITPFIFIVLSLLGVEISSLIIARQPITTTWRGVNKNGLLTNIENGLARHDYWGDIKQVYAFGEYGNRISLNKNKNKKFNDKLSDKETCKYLVLGDSISFGWLVDNERIFPTLLQNYFNKKYNDKVVFINSSAGGWGIADYHAYIDIYSKKLNKLKLNGIIVFINFDDARRAAISNLYETNIKGNEISIKRTNKFYFSKNGKIKRFFNHSFVAPIYNFSQINFNSARVLKNGFLNGVIETDPIKSNKTWSLKGDFDYELINDPVENNKDIAIVKRAYLDLFSSASKVAPLQLVHTGILPLENMTSINKHFFSEKGGGFLSNQKIMYDFSTTGKDIILSDEEVIKYDGHPNNLGHLKIYENILSSKSKKSLNNFIKKTCQ